jgi:uncharacterized membrane protein
MNAARISNVAVALLFALMAVVVAWQCTNGLSPERLLAAVVLTCPLWAPLRGMLRRNRKTYAWATLCVIPYFVLGVTEAVATAERRLWAALCLALAFALFVALILYLRVTNPARNPPLTAQAPTSTSAPQSQI